MYSGPVKEELSILHYPEGDTREIAHPIRPGALVDINGNLLPLPLPTIRMIAYRTWKISSESTRNEEITHYWLEQVFPGELRDYAAP